MRTALGDHVAAFVEVKERLGLLRIAYGGDDDLIKDVRRALDDLGVAVGKRIKGSRDEADGHLSPLVRFQHRYERSAVSLGFRDLPTLGRVHMAVVLHD